MAPEYASEGLFSIKSDVFSFGVLTLEIVSGKRSSGIHRYGDFINLLGHVSFLCTSTTCKQFLSLISRVESTIFEAHCTCYVQSANTHYTNILLQDFCFSPFSRRVQKHQKYCLSCALSFLNHDESHFRHGSCGKTKNGFKSWIQH